MSLPPIKSGNGAGSRKFDSCLRAIIVSFPETGFASKSIFPGHYLAPSERARKISVDKLAFEIPTVMPTHDVNYICSL